VALSSHSGGTPSGVASSSASAPGGSHASGSPATGATSATTSLIAVTVCSEPVGGCTYAGASQVMEIQPRQILVSQDGASYVDNLTWTGWGQSQATATGTLKVSNCTPSCAQGTPTSYPATVTLAGLKPYGTGLEAYSTIVIRSPAAGKTFSYSKDTVP